MAEIHPAEFPTAQGDYEFARRVAELSKGRIKIEVYPGGVLGDELSVLEQVQFGGIDLARVSIAAVEPFAPQMAALFMPYIYRDQDHMWRVLTGPIGQKLLADLEHGRLIGLGWFEAGARSFYTVNKPVRRVGDLKGMKIRVQESPPMISLLQSFSALARPMVFSVVYSALRTGAIDGAENNLATYYASGHYQVAPFYVLDEHARLPEVIIASPVAFAEISRLDQKLIRQAASDAIAYQRRIWAKYEAEITLILKSAGVSFLLSEDQEQWHKLARRVWSAQSIQVRSLLEQIQNTR